MKKTLLTIIVSLIGAMVSVSWAQEAPIKVACVGNSITEGVGTKSKKTESYPAVMQRIMGEKYEVKNFGYSGRTMLNKGDRPYTGILIQFGKGILPVTGRCQRSRLNFHAIGLMVEPYHISNELHWNGVRCLFVLCVVLL